MEKQCCNFSVTELENGYRFEVTGEEVKGRCKAMFEKCCTGENMKNCFQMFGELKKDRGCC